MTGAGPGSPTGLSYSFGLTTSSAAHSAEHSFTPGMGFAAVCKANDLVDPPDPMATSSGSWQKQTLVRPTKACLA